MYRTFKVKTSIFKKPSDVVKVSVKSIIQSLNTKINFIDFRLKYLEVGMCGVKEDYISCIYFTKFDTPDEFIHINDAYKKRDMEKCAWHYCDSYIPLNYAVALFEHLGYGDNETVIQVKSNVLHNDAMRICSKIPYGMKISTPFRSYRPKKLRANSESNWLSQNCEKFWYSSWEDKSHYISYKYKLCKLK